MSAPGAGQGTPSLLRIALLCRCPRCGRGHLFAGYLNQAHACDACGLDFRPLQAGDGPAVFAILIVGAIVAGSALLVEVAFQPPYWVHALLWVPAIFLLSLGLLRPLKAWLIASQYRHRAEDGTRER